MRQLITSLNDNYTLRVCVLILFYTKKPDILVRLLSYILNMSLGSVLVCQVYVFTCQSDIGSV